jgi:hypothetical protein
MVVAHINGDGLPDLVVAVSNGNTVSVLLANGDGTFKNHIMTTVGSDPIGVTVADFNGDNLPDVVTANSSSNDVSVLINAADWLSSPAAPGRPGADAAFRDLGAALTINSRLSEARTAMDVPAAPPRSSLADTGDAGEVRTGPAWSPQKQFSPHEQLGRAADSIRTEGRWRRPIRRRHM